MYKKTHKFVCFIFKTTNINDNKIAEKHGIKRKKYKHGTWWITLYEDDRRWWSRKIYDFVYIISLWYRERERKKEERE